MAATSPPTIVESSGAATSTHVGVSAASEGHWRKRDADAAANPIENRYKLSRVRDILLRGDDVTLFRVPDVAAFLGVSHQRVDLSGERLHTALGGDST